MKKTRTSIFWDDFLKHGTKRPGKNISYSSWHFCNNQKDADDLAELVLKGIKTATSSLKWAYEFDGDPLPQPGDYSVVTNWDGDPVCVIKTIEVQVLPFIEVDKDIAFDEGEGDRSLEYWRRVHKHVFCEECKAIGRTPTDDMPVVTERFIKVYPE